MQYYECGFCTLLFYVIIELPEGKGIFSIDVPGGNNYGNMFSGGGWYSNTNTTLMIQFFHFIFIIGGGLTCNSIMMILLSFFIRCRLVMWYILLYTTIIGGTGCFLITPTLFWIVFTRAVWLILYKYSQKGSNKNIVRSKLNTWYIFHLEY